MKFRNPSLPVALTAILVGVLAGYLAGEISHRSERATASHTPAGEMKTAAAHAHSAPRIFQPAPLPEPAATDAAQFDAFVTKLVRDGFSEKHARWLALRSLSERDMGASLALAREWKELDIWAAGAAEVDPAQTFALLEGLGDRERTAAQWALFATLGRLDPKAGLRFLVQLNPPSRLNARTAVEFFRSWATTASFDIVAAAVEDLPPPLRRSAMYGLFRTWRETDREGMLEWASTRGPREAKLAFRSLDDPGVIRDPEELFDLAVRFPTATDWLTLAIGARQLADRGADGFRPIAELPPGPMRASTIPRFASDFAHRDPEAAWEFMTTLPPEDQTQFFDGAISRFSKIKPREVAEKLVSGEFDTMYFSQVMEAWGQQDPRQALDWTQRNLAGGAQLTSLEKIFSSWGEKAPAEAALALRALPAGLRASALPAVAESFGVTDPRAALAWVEQLPAVERSRASSGVIRGWATKDPAAAAQALAALPPENMDEAFEIVSRRFAQSDPATATQWAAALSDEKLRNAAIDRIIGTVAQQNAELASEYLTDLAPGAFRDHAVAGFVDSVHGLDPKSAAGWAASIQSPDLRHSHLGNVLRAWREQDRAAAQAFARGISNESLRSEMLKLVNE